MVVSRYRVAASASLATSGADSAVAVHDDPLTDVHTVAVGWSPASVLVPAINQLGSADGGKTAPRVADRPPPRSRSTPVTRAQT
jgi:hypothetical protein